MSIDEYTYKQIYKFKDISNYYIYILNMNKTELVDKIMALNKEIKQYQDIFCIINIVYNMYILD